MHQRTKEYISLKFVPLIYVLYVVYDVNCTDIITLITNRDSKHIFYKVLILEDYLQYMYFQLYINYFV